MLQGSGSRLRVKKLAYGLCVGTIFAVLGACSEDGGFVQFRPKISVDPAAGTPLSFGEVVLTRTTAKPNIIMVSNIGEAVLLIDEPSFEGQEAGLFRVSSYPRVLVPGQQGEIFVRFEPKGPVVEASAVLKISSNDLETAEVSFPLIGTAREPCVLFADQARMTFDVGDVKTVNLSSLSTYACVIDRITTDASVFPILNLPDLPHVVPAGEVFPLEIEHTPVSSRRARKPGS